MISVSNTEIMITVFLSRKIETKCNNNNLKEYSSTSGLRK